jgi:hypothetical protein
VHPAHEAIERHTGDRSLAHPASTPRPPQRRGASTSQLLHPADSRTGLRAGSLASYSLPRSGRCRSGAARDRPFRRSRRSLDDVDAACINGNYAATAGLAPNRDAIVAEGGGVGEAIRSPYSNVVAVRAADRNQPWVEQLLALYHASETRGFILRTFGGAIFPAF